MANATKLLNNLNPAGENLIFYTELESDLQVGDRVFIIGGNYDNTIYTDNTHSSYDPFNPFAMGYTVLAIDNTNTSNAITLNIPYRNAEFNSVGIETTVFSPLSVYKSEDELLVDPNQTRESWISKSYFKRGEFNGGEFQDGVFGEYNIKGDAPGLREYERQHFVDLLADALEGDTEREEEYEALTITDYSLLEAPAVGNKAIFNNNYQNVAAKFSGGVFLGGDYQWGTWECKYSDNKYGKFQELAEDGGLRDPLDQSKFNIVVFDDNNGGLGYSTLASGNVGRIYASKENHEIEFLSDEQKIQIDYLPFELKKALDFNFDLQIRVHSEKNNKVFDIKGVEINSSTAGKFNYILLEDFQTYELLETGEEFQIKQLLFDETGEYRVELMVKDGIDQPNNFNKGKLQNVDWFGGKISEAHIQGGDFHYGEFQQGRISSKYSRCYWNDGVFNGLKEFSIAEDLRWRKGKFLDGNWKGDFNIPIKDQNIENNTITLTVRDIYKHLLKMNEEVFVSYLKTNTTNVYLSNYTDDPDVNLINFQTFKLTNIIDNDDTKSRSEVILELEGFVDLQTDINLQYAKISQSHFIKGHWRDGVWETGLRKVINNRIESFDAGTSFLENNKILFYLNDVANLEYGEQIHVSNLQFVREINIDLIPDLIVDDRNNIEYFESFDSFLTILEIDTVNKTVLAEFPQLDDIETDEEITWTIGGDLIDVRLIQDINARTELSPNIWENGTFDSGAWRGGIWKDGLFNSFLYFDQDNENIQSVWQVGYWKNGTWENSAFLSGVWQDGLFTSGVMTNLYENKDINKRIGWDPGDSVWIDGTITGGIWRRGLFLDGVNDGATIINGAIENIDFKSGTYTNGLGVFDNTINSNRSGRLSDADLYTDLSAPSMVYIDGDGWVQLDQNSFYQKDYNIIFQDLNIWDNPFDNQMFNVLNRDKYGSRLLVEYGTSGNGDNPLMLLPEFQQRKPILSIDTIADTCEVEKTTSNHKIWVADSGHQRILEVDQITNRVDVLGRILGDSSKDIFTFSDLKFIACANRENSVWVYVVDGNTIKLISKDKTNILSYSPTLNTGEEFVDVQVVATNENLPETVLLLTNQNNVFYFVNGFTEFKSFSTDITGTDASISILRGETTNSINLFVKYLNTSNVYTIAHRVLDYNISLQTYSIRTPLPSVIAELSTLIGEDKIVSFTSKFESNYVRFWIVLENSNGLQKAYVFNYRTFFTGNINEFFLLNENDLNFNVNRIQMGFDNEYLQVIGLDNTYGYPLLFAQADLTKTSTGFGDTNSQIKLLNIFQNLDFTDEGTSSTAGDSIVDYTYWYYDLSDQTNRIVYIDESIDDLFDPNIDIDTIDSSNYRILKMVPGSNSSEIYSIMIDDSTNEYFVRKTQSGKQNAQNSTIYNLSGVNRIYDIVFNKNKLFMFVEDDSNVNRLVAIENFVSTTQDISTLGYSANTSGFSGINNFKIDIIENGADFLGVLWCDDEKVYELRIDDTDFEFIKIYDGITGVQDIALSRSHDNDHFSLYIAYSTGVYRSISDREIVTGSLQHYRWSEIVNGDNVYDNLNIKEIYRSSLGTKMIVKYGSKFDIFDPDYTNNEYVVDDVVIGSDGQAYGFSQQRLVKFGVDGTSFEVLKDSNDIPVGLYNQRNRIKEFDASELADDDDNLLNNPKSLLLAENFSGVEDYLFWIDNTTVSDESYIRFFALTSKFFGVAKVTASFADLDLQGLSYDKNNQRVYYVYNNDEIGYLDYNLLDTFNNTVYTSGIVGANLIDLSYFILGGIEYLTLYTDTDEIYLHSITNILNESLITVSDPVDGIVVNTDGASTTIYYQVDGITKFITTTETVEGDLLDDANWTSESSISDYNTIVSMNEYRPLNSPAAFGGDALVIYEEDTNEIVIFEKDAVNEDTVSIKDITFNEFTADSDYIFMYNNPNTASASGIIRQQRTSNTNVSIFINNQLDDISTSTFRKIVNTSDTIAYALFDDGIYRYDFTGGSEIVTKLATPEFQFRDVVEPNPIDVADYIPVAVDMTVYDINGTPTLMVLYEIYTPLNVATGHYDVFLFDELSFTKTGIEHLYGSINAEDGVDAIDTDGDIDTIRLADSPPDVGGIKHLFKSSVSPKLFAKNESLYFFFDNSTEQFIRISEAATVTIVENSEFGDLKLKVQLPDLNKSVETLASNAVTIFADPSSSPLDFDSGLESDSISSTYSVGTEIVVSATDYDTFVATFDKPVGVNWVTGSSFKAVVKTTLGVAQTPAYSDVLDFLVYEANSGSGDFDQIVIRQSSSGNAITTYDGLDTYWELNNTSTGIWDIEDIVNSTNERTILGPSSANASLSLGVIDTDINDNNETTLFFKILTELVEKYDFNIYNRGYKVITDQNQVLTPYLTGRVLYNTILHEDVLFNNIGTPFTAHVVNTRWKSGLFLGSWDAPFYFDHKVKEGFSVFLDGIFEGNFYDGFFLGGIFRNNITFDSIVSQGHFSSDNLNIDFQTGTVNSLYRHDILEASWSDNKIKLLTEGLKFENGDYSNTIISNITKGTWVRIPNLFKNEELNIIDITKGKIAVEGFDEVIFKCEKPEQFNEDLLLGKEIFVQAFEYVEYLFGSFVVRDAFVDDNYMYLTVRSEFNEFVDGIYEPVVRPKLIFNTYLQVQTSSTYFDEKLNKWYSEYEFDLLVPSTITNNKNKLTFIQNKYLLESRQILNDGDFSGYIVIPDYLQIFNFSLTKTDNELLAFFQSEFINAYVQDVISNNNTSRIEVNLGIADVSLFAHDIMVNNSYITTPTTRVNDYLSNNIFLSGKTDRPWRTGAWLNLDEKGFSNGYSEFGSIQTNTDGTLQIETPFDGGFSKIVNIYFEGENYLWVELDEILFDIDKYRYITLRGFTGNKSKLIGAEASNVFRIVDIDNNFIKINNPFKFYSGITPKDYFSNFNMDQLQLRTQTMSIFNTSVGIEQGAFYSISELDVLYGSIWREYAGLENPRSGRIGVDPYTGGIPKISDEDYYEIMNELEPGSGDVLRSVVEGGGFDGIGLMHFLEYGTQEPSTIPGSLTAHENYRFGEEVLLNKILEKEILFEYGYASPSAWNGGDFYGEMNSVWNAGTFKNGNFNGLWYGSTESYGWEGIVGLTTENLGTSYLLTLDLNNASVLENDLVYVKFSSIFFDSELKDVLEGFYANVIDKNNGTASTSGNDLVVELESDNFVEPGLYSINLVRYRVGDVIGNNSNYLIVDYNSNIASSENVSDHLILDYVVSASTSSNYVIDFSGENSSIATIDLLNIANSEGDPGEFTIDLYFNYDVTNIIQPIFSFIDSGTISYAGIKLYVDSDNLVLEYNSPENANSQLILYSSLSDSVWYHIALFYNNGVLTVRLDNANEKSFSIDLDLLTHDVNFIAKNLFLDSNEQIDSIFYSGKLDEIRIWNKDVYTEFVANEFWNKKFINKYISELVAYYSGDGQLDLSNLYPEEEQYLQFNEFLPVVSDPVVITKDNGEDFIYSEDNLFYELDFFPDKSLLNVSGEYKILTLEETRDISDSTDPSRVAKYYLEVILEDTTNSTSGFAYPPNSYTIELRERATISGNSLPADNRIFYENNIVFGNIDISIYGEFWKWNNLIINDNAVFLDGNKIGDYSLFNRNLFKHTVQTRAYLGYYEFANILEFPYTEVDETPGFIGFVKNVNIWRNSQAKDEYLIYRIKSGENTDILSLGDIVGENDTISNVNSNVSSIDPSSFVIPYFNDDGSQIWEYSIYASENYTINDSGIVETSPVTDGSTIDELTDDLRFINVEQLNTALPEDTWLEGTDFVQLTQTSPFGEDFDVSISNMEDFKFFGKNFDVGGNTNLKILSSGHVFFEQQIPGIPLLYPANFYVDLPGEVEYNQTSTTDAIFINNTSFDSRNGTIEYADRETEFILKYYGKTEFNTNDETTEIFSFFVLRIDKVNSNILIYTRRLNETDDNKYQGLRRSDRTWNYINDTNDLSYYKIPEVNAPNPEYDGDSDYVIGFESIDDTVNSSNATEYVLYVPRFELGTPDNSFVDYIRNEDYDNLQALFGIEIALQYDSGETSQYNLVEENIGLTPYYFRSLSDITVFDGTNFQNQEYDLSEQFLNTQLETDVARVSFFENGNFNADRWHNGIFVNGLIDKDNFIWKYGIKHNGRIEGNENISGYAHWLGGFHLGETDNSFMRNNVWYRGYFNAGQWEKGDWLALNLDNSYLNSSSGVNNDWSIWEGGEWYSTINIQNISELFSDPNLTNGSTNLVESGPPVTRRSTVDVIDSGILWKRISKLGAYPYITHPLSIKKNIKYRLRLTLSSTGFNELEEIAVFFTNSAFVGPSVDIKYVQSFSNNNVKILNGNTILSTINEKEQVMDFVFVLDENDPIEPTHITFYKTYPSELSNGFDTLLTNISLSLYSEYDSSNHESIWHGGIWRSPVIDGFTYTYENTLFDNYTVANDNILQLPKVNSIWLGGLWLRGQFEGGIFANGIWNSVTEDLAFSGTFGTAGLYEEKIKLEYDETYSTWDKGLMMNSIWEGGIVEDNIDKLETVFGDLTNLFSTQNIQNDFVWDNGFRLKKSDSSQSYTTLFGKDFFTGYNNSTNSTLTDENEIQLQRVIDQFTNDGIMSVYWRRGIFNNGIFQFSKWGNRDLDNVESTIITKDKVLNESVFNSGVFYYSTWDGGLFNAEPTNDTYPLELDITEPNSLFYRSQWNKGYWSVSDNGLETDDSDTIRITDALFSRSLWTAGVFEGGMMDLSIWRSGVESETELHYFNDTVDINIAEDGDLTMAMPNSITTPAATSFFDVDQIPSLQNGTNFLTNLETSGLRLMGNVDNFASIWVNGCMRGSVWHGGVWQRGMFIHRDFEQNDLDFFDDNVATNDEYQVGVFLRGMWLSGYFSYYNDRNIDFGQAGGNFAYGENNEHLLEDEKFRRCLFMSIQAGGAGENDNIFGIAETLIESIKTEISTDPVNSDQNYASVFARKLIKQTDTNPTALKPYWTQMNGSMLNGLFYDNAADLQNQERAIISLFASVSDLYASPADSAVLTQVSLNYFQESIKISQNSEFFVPYTIISPLYYNSVWSKIGLDNFASFSYLSGIWNNQSLLQWKNLNIWRHNNGSQSTSGDGIGDATIVESLPTVEFENEDVTVSIAQGCGLEWIPGEPYGEPRHTDEIGTDENGFIGEIADFDPCEFDAGTNGIGGEFDVGEIECTP
jgi:hypothetical protein